MTALTLEDAANIANIVEVAIWLIITISGGALAIGYIAKMRPVWKRFTENVQRQVAVISTEQQPMEHEAELLERVGYFNKVKRVDADARNLTLLDGSAVIVVGYSPNSTVYKETFEYAKTHKLPLIVFSGRNRLSNEDRDALKSYSFSSLCETDLRLVSDVFAVMSTFRGVA